MKMNWKEANGISLTFLLEFQEEVQETTQEEINRLLLVNVCQSDERTWNRPGLEYI